MQGADAVPSCMALTMLVRSWLGFGDVGGLMTVGILGTAAR